MDTQAAYRGLPLADVPPKVRGDILETVTRDFLRRENTVEDAPRTACVNGQARGRNSTTCDFLVNGKRVEIKAAQLRYDARRRYWSATWRWIKSDAHDELYLILYAPTGAYAYKHDGVFGVSTTGMAHTSCGGKIQVYGPCRVESPQHACRCVHEKLAHMFVTHVSMDDLRGYSRVSRTQEVFRDVPLSGMTPCARGVLLERVARAHLEDLLHLATEDAPSGRRVDGRKRGRNQTTCDFLMEGRRIEVKACQLKFETSRRRWRAHWQNIKRDAHDVLFLVLYTPLGLFLYKHDGTFGVCTAGKSHASCGGSVDLHSLHNVESWETALSYIRARLETACALVAHLTWDDVRAKRVARAS